jgi:LysM repeat protein
MKRCFYLSLLSLLCAAPALRAEDAASIAARQEADENYKMVKARVDDLTEARDALTRRIQSLEKEISDLRAQIAKPSGNYASTDDLKHLADAIQKVDEKRVADNKEIIKEIGKLGSTLTTKSTTHVKDTPRVDDPVPPPIDPNQSTLTYTIKPNDTYSTIALAYRKEGIKVTAEDIEKANPNVKPTQLYVGKKILVPDTRSSSTNKPDAK